VGLAEVILSICHSMQHYQRDWNVEAYRHADQLGGVGLRNGVDDHATNPLCFSDPRTKIARHAVHQIVAAVL